MDKIYKPNAHIRTLSLSYVVGVCTYHHALLQHSYCLYLVNPYFTEIYLDDLISHNIKNLIQTVICTEELEVR